MRICFDAEVRDGTLPAVFVCPERSQPIIPLNYLLTRWNWCFWSSDWIIRNVGHSYSPWLVSLICPIWSPCLSNLISCTTYSCWTIIHHNGERQRRCFIYDTKVSMREHATVHGFKTSQGFSQKDPCFQVHKPPHTHTHSHPSFHISSPFSLNSLGERVGTGPGRHQEQESARGEWQWLCLL